jgi:hypothetical protein
VSIKKWLVEKISLLFQPIVDSCIERAAYREIGETVELIKESDSKADEITVSALKRYRETRKLKSLSDDIQNMQKWKVQKEKSLAKQRKKKKSITRQAS